MELLASFCLCFLKKTVRQDGVHGAVTLNLQLGVSLTAEKVAALTHDIVWMEEAEVNGQKVYPLTFKLSLVDQVKKGELSYKEAQERYRIQRAELAADVSFEI